MNDDRLDSWKDIASYFGKNIRTVQRWEKLEGLPVHRHPHRKRASPFAYRRELDAWWANRGHELNGADGSAQQNPDHDPALDPDPTIAASTTAARWRRFLGDPGRLAASVAAMLLLTALTFGATPGDRAAWIPSGPSEPAHWILVAEFVGPKDEPSLALVVRELVISALAQSRIVTPISTLELRSGLRAAMLADTTRVVGEVARQLAYRASARAYIEGRVDRVGNGFFVLLRMLDAETGALRFSISDLAEDRDRLIPALDRLSRRLRQALGENQEVVRATRPYSQAITPSFEAFCLYQASLDARVRDVDKVRAQRLAREALAIDPDFAQAWWHLAMMTLDVGARDSREVATAAFLEARRRPDRLTTVQRLLLEVDYQREICANLPAAYRAACEAVQQARSFEAASALHSMGLILGYMGHPDQEADCLARAASLSPFGLHEVVLYHLANASLNQGRLSQAIQISKKLTGARHELLDLWLAEASLDWPQVVRLGRHLSQDPLLGPADRMQMLTGVAGALAAQGELGEAVLQLRAVEQDTTGYYWPWFASFARAFISARLQGSAEPQPAVPVPEDATTERLIELGLLAAVRGDTLDASRALHMLDSRRTEQSAGEHAADVDLLRAWIAFDRGSWTEVLRLLEPVATDGLYLWPGRVPCRWLMAEVCERLGDTAKAVSYYEMTLVSKGTDTSDRNGLLGFVAPFAHARLVEIYSKTGPDAEARRHWKALQAACGHADCDLLPLVGRARAAMSASRSNV